MPIRSALWGAVCCALAIAATAQARPTPPRTAVRVVVVANFENGADSGDQPGEYQDWVEREHLTEKVSVRGAPNVLRRNRAGLYGLILRHGVTDLAAFVLDPRFDLRRTYWLFTGISGVDPRVASVGSAAWARWVVNGDELREIDDRTIPAGWPYGLWPIGASKPNELPVDPNHFGSATVDDLSMAYPLNQGLARWAFNRTKGVKLGDAEAVRARRQAWEGFPKAQQPPFVLMGETLGSVRYWHGEARTKWAEDWVNIWTRGKGVFVMTNMESQTYQRAMRVFATQGFIDAARIMVLRTASNFSEPPPGVPVTASIGDEEPGQALAYDSNQRVGAPVLHELLDHWSLYRTQIPNDGD